MPKKRQSETSVGDYTILGIKVDDFTVHSTASQNMYGKGTLPVFTYEDNLLHNFRTSLEITGTCTYPEERAGDEYFVEVIGEESSRGELTAKIKNYHARNTKGDPVYKKRKAGLVPVYDTPKGLSVLNKVRGEPAWSTFVFVSPRLVSDMLVQLTQIRPLWLYLDEHKVDRRRWIRSIALQSVDPGEE